MNVQNRHIRTTEYTAYNVLIVCLSPFVICQRFIGVADFCELFFSCLFVVWVGVRVVRLGQLVIRFLEIRFGNVSRDAEDFVVVSFVQGRSGGVEVLSFGRVVLLLRKWSCVKWR